MDPETAKSWLEVLRDLGAGGMAVGAGVVWLLYKGKLRWERDVTKCEKESAEWKHAALSGTGVLEKLTPAVETLTTMVERIEARRL